MVRASVDAHLVLMSVSVCELRELFITETAAVGILTSVHVDVVFHIIQLGVGDAAVLADELLVQPLCLLVVLGSLVVPEVVTL